MRIGRLMAAIARTLSERGRLVEALQRLSSALARAPDLSLRDELVVVSEIVTRRAPQTP
jgi:hypothetical protein